MLGAGGRLLSQAYTEFPQYFPRPGWVEHDPDKIWTSTQTVVRAAIARGRIRPHSIASIGITNQRETTVLWQRSTGRPIGRAIVWQCRRSFDLCDLLRKKGLGPVFRRKTGLVLDAYFSGTKIRWALDHWPTARRLARKGDLAFGTIDSWLIWKLTGGKAHLTDPTNASRTLLYNIYQKQWDPELYRILKIPQSILPEVKPSAGLFAHTQASRILPKGIPITGVAGDQQASLFGHGCDKPGAIKNTYGTGCFILLNTGDRALKPQAGLLTTLACGPKGRPAFCLEGSIFIAGAIVQWLRDAVQMIQKAPESEKIARTVKDTAGVYLVPALTGLGAPYWDMEARGAILGLTRGSGKAQIVRAALESITYQTRDCIEAMQKNARIKVKLLRADGGTTQNNLLMQFQSDILGVPVERARSTQVTALGAAALAGIGAGIWADTGPIRQLIKKDRRFNPHLSYQKRNKLYMGWKQAVARIQSK